MFRDLFVVDMVGFCGLRKGMVNDLVRYVGFVRFLVVGDIGIFNRKINGEVLKLVKLDDL